MHLVRAERDASPRIEAKLVEASCLYDWPGNVRELALLVRRLLAIHGHEPAIGQQHLPDKIKRPTAAPREGESEDPLVVLGKALLKSGAADAGRGRGGASRGARGAAKANTACRAATTPAAVGEVRDPLFTSFGRAA